MMVCTKGNTNRECSLFWSQRGMKRKKKPLRWGCEGWRPFVGVMPKTNGKQAPPLSFAVTPTVARDARPLTSLTVSEKKSLREKKVGYAEKKHACRFSKSRIFRIAARGKPALGRSWQESIAGGMWHETNKKSRYGGDVRAGALSWV